MSMCVRDRKREQETGIHMIKTSLWNGYLKSDSMWHFFLQHSHISTPGSILKLLQFKVSQCERTSCVWNGQESIIQLEIILRLIKYVTRKYYIYDLSTLLPRLPWKVVCLCIYHIASNYKDKVLQYFELWMDIYTDLLLRYHLLFLLWRHRTELKRKTEAENNDLSIKRKRWLHRLSQGEFG